MILSSFILSIFAFLVSTACLVWLLAKHFSTHSIQYVDPLKSLGLGDDMPMGKSLKDEFREIGDPIDEDELMEIKNKVKK